MLKIVASFFSLREGTGECESAHGQQGTGACSAKTGAGDYFKQVSRDSEVRFFFFLSFFLFTRVDVSGLVCIPGYGYHDLSQRHLSNVLFQNTGVTV